ALNNLSNQSSFSGDYNLGLKYAQEALPYFENDSSMLPFVYHNHGAAYKGLKNYEKAEEYFKRAIVIREEHNVTKDRLETQNQLARLYLDWNKPEAGLQIANVAYKEAEAKHLFF